VLFVSRMMKRKNGYLVAAFAVLIAILWIFFTPEKEENLSERVKISLREVGNQLLLANQDSTSLVLPVIELDPSLYGLSFERPLSITPNDIVGIVKTSFQKAALPEQYLIEVIQCEDEEVAYSYGIYFDTEKDIIPCANRVLPKNCFTIKARFTEIPVPLVSRQQWLMLLLILFLGLLILAFRDRLLVRFRESKKNQTPSGTTTAHTAIGMFAFYPEQNKLVKEAVEIGLSKKECELLAIFVAQPNQIIKRDELTKRVWEDHGVVVGRSLDTYISKLRKKLKEDTSIKITNVHGVGYKLEMHT
jgi:cbb3-type cytochrome oxidase subunit 3